MHIFSYWQTWSQMPICLWKMNRTGSTLCQKHEFTFVSLSRRRLHVHMAGGGSSGRILLPGGGFNVPLRPPQTQKENEKGLHSCSTEQHLLALLLKTFAPQRPSVMSFFSLHRELVFSCIACRWCFWPTLHLQGYFWSLLPSIHVVLLLWPTGNTLRTWKYRITSSEF